MALPGSGTLYLNGINSISNWSRGIFIEKVGAPSPSDAIGQANWHNTHNGTYPLRLRELSDGTQSGTINIVNLNANKPDTDAPYRMSEFYQYDDDASLNAAPGSFSAGSSGSTGNTVIVSHATYSNWTILPAGMPASWVTITTGANQSFLGNGSVVFNVSSNSSSSSRSTTIVITFTVGTTFGDHYPTVGSNSTTTRTINISQSAGSGSGGQGRPPGGGLDP